MKVSRFEDLIIWQESRLLINEIYKVFNMAKDYAFKDQIQRASVSVMNNIAEGFERQSNKEFMRFLYIARGSCGEVRSMLYIAKDLKYIDPSSFETLQVQTRKISISTYKLIKSIEGKG